MKYYRDNYYGCIYKLDNDSWYYYDMGRNKWAFYCPNDNMSDIFRIVHVYEITKEEAFCELL